MKGVHLELLQKRWFLLLVLLVGCLYVSISECRKGIAFLLVETSCILSSFKFKDEIFVF